MKTSEEIKHLAEKSVEDVKKDHADYRFREVYKEFYIEGYTQCQEDIVDKLLLNFANALNEEAGFPLNSEGFEEYITEFLNKQD